MMTGPEAAWTTLVTAGTEQLLEKAELVIGQLDFTGFAMGDHSTIQALTIRSVVKSEERGVPSIIAIACGFSFGAEYAALFEDEEKLTRSSRRGRKSGMRRNTPA
jgi:hypothetical protein